MMNFSDSKQFLGEIKNDVAQKIIWYKKMSKDADCLD